MNIQARRFLFCGSLVAVWLAVVIGCVFLHAHLEHEEIHHMARAVNIAGIIFGFFGGALVVTTAICSGEGLIDDLINAVFPPSEEDRR